MTNRHTVACVNSHECIRQDDCPHAQEHHHSDECNQGIKLCCCVPTEADVRKALVSDYLDFLGDDARFSENLKEDDDADLSGMR